MFQDEGRFGLPGPLRWRRAPRNVRQVVGARLERKYLYAFATVSPQDGAFGSLILPWVNVRATLLFLAEVVQRDVDESIMMVMDQADWRVAGATYRAQHAGGVLVACSRELNSAEHLWESLREDY